MPTRRSVVPEELRRERPQRRAKVAASARAAAAIASDMAPVDSQEEQQEADVKSSQKATRAVTRRGRAATANATSASASAAASAAAASAAESPYTNPDTKAKTVATRTSFRIKKNVRVMRSSTASSSSPSSSSSSAAAAATAISPSSKKSAKEHLSTTATSTAAVTTSAAAGIAVKKCKEDKEATTKGKSSRSPQKRRRQRHDKYTPIDSSSSDPDFEPLSEGIVVAASRTRERRDAERRKSEARRSGGGAGDQAMTPRTKKPRKETAVERLKRLHPEIEGVWAELAQQQDEAPAVPAITPPEALAVKLLPFQIEGVSWMCYQEEHSVFHGGILADEMGMGKTIQTIALLLARPGDKPVLVVCPTVALLQWRAEIEARTKPDTLSTHVYHGQGRVRDKKELEKADVILTTYATVESEFRRQTSGFTRGGVKMTEASTLHGLSFHRIVLDEAHFIKDRSSNTARAVFALEADYKWSLSGTPLQNRVGELYSLVKFMRADPYSYYYCRQCDCKSLYWRFSGGRTCECCGHRRMSHFCWWNNQILKPIQKFGPVGEGLAAYNRLGLLLGSMMIRRTKADKGHELGLPPRVVFTRRDLFSEEEEDFYRSLFKETRTKFASFVRAGTLLNNYAHIFELLMRMRQAVGHPWLITHRVASDKDEDVCGICHDTCEDPVISGCKHVFCREDVRMYLSSSLATNTACPVCFQPLSVDLTQLTYVCKRAPKSRKPRESIVRRLDFEQWRSSTKIEALLEELSAGADAPSTVKSIVFSQFTQFLDLLEWRLQRAGFRCVKLDGRMQPSARAAVIEAFNTVPQITVFLISLKAGGLALNLTAASRVFIMDPWWNPAVESQAMDRIHRLGQRRPIQVKRILIENSIESRIDQLQEKKRLLFESTVGRDRASLNRLTEEDLQFLFL